jgi:uncharacterized membrane protein YcaP (DUF421 family)
VVIAFVVVAIERIISYFATRNERFEARTQDHLDVLVEDSVLRLKEMKRTRITKDRLCAHLRAEGLTHLGGVQRLYLEANGSFTLIRAPEAKPGLNILPAWDEDFIQELDRTDVLVCALCGKEQGAEDIKGTCFNCNSTEWDHAVTDNVHEGKEREMAEA